MKRTRLVVLMVFGMLAALLPAGAVPVGAVSTTLVINEIDYDQPGSDTAEFLEIKNLSDEGIDLSSYQVEMVNGSSGAVYKTIDLPAVTLAAGDYFVICGDAGNVAECDLDVAPDSNLIQNGSPDAVSLWFAGLFTRTLIDTVSYEGDTVAPYTEGTGVGLADSSSADFLGISRFPDGVDTDQNASDLSQRCITPGAANTADDTSCGPPPMVVPIYAIQGTGQFSPYEGMEVTTEGIVTLITANGRDLWIQDPVGDGNAATSDGINVDDGARFSDAEVGDFVQVTAEVREQQFGNALPLTRLDGFVTVEVLSTGNPLPAPVPLIDLPNEVLADGINFWEPLEGMLVSAENGTVTSPTNGFGEFGFLTPADAVEGSGFFADPNQIIVRDLGSGDVDYNPERIMVDDSALDTPDVRPGDAVNALVGVVDYTFSMYKLQLVSIDVSVGPIPDAPVSSRTDLDGAPGPQVLSVTTWNVENLFDRVVAAKDAVGELGWDPGSFWGSGDTTTRNDTLRRMETVCEGITGEDSFYDPADEWIGYPINTFDGLGEHTVTCGPTADLLLSEYVEGSSLNKGLEIYNGTGAEVDLAAEGYQIDIFFNGADRNPLVIPLTGVIANGDVHVLAHSSADFAGIADQTSSDVLFNGDDTVVLRKGSKDDAGSTPSEGALETKLSKLALAFDVELNRPDILIVQEIENTEVIAGDENGYVPGSTIPALLPRLGGKYEAVSFETSDARGIEVGFIWNTQRVQLLDAFQMAGADVEEWYGPESPSPGREPLVGVFQFKGREITIVGNHFKSKSGDDPLYGVLYPPIRITEVQRKGQATVVADFVEMLLDADPGAHVMVAGDLNDFAFAEPGEGTDHPVGILEDAGLTNLVNVEPEAERFSFIFDGNSQVLDHMLVSAALLEGLQGADFLHFNVSYPFFLEFDATTPLATSDHDAFEGRFDLKERPGRSK